MAGMIFGYVPTLEEVLASVEALNNIVNRGSATALFARREGR